MNTRMLTLTIGALLACGASATAQTAPTKPAASPRVFVAIDGGAQLTPTSADSTVTYKLYGEDAVLKAGYETKVVPVFGARLGARVWRRVVVGVGATLFTSNGDAAIDAQLPHPFFFQRRRAVEGSASSIKRDEAVVYGEVGWLAPVSDRIDLLVFGGPAFFSATQEVATKVQFTEQYPFDAATFSSVEAISKKVTSTGFTVGADVAYLITKSVRVGALIRFSHATADVEPLDKQPFRITLGGLQASAGVRFRF